VDITVPVYSFSETHYNSLAFVTESYKQTLFGLTGKVNNAAFKGFAAGEVLFLGASGSKRGDEDHGYADIADGDTAKLASGTSGAYILWKEAGAGTKWAIVRLGTYAGESGSAQIRRARAQENSPADQYLSVKLLDASGNPVGAAFDATEVNGRVFTSLNPNVLTGDDLLVAQVDDTWYVLNFTPSQSSQGNVVRVTITGVGGVYTWIEAQLHDGTPITLYNVNGNPWQDLLPNLKNTTNRNKCFALNVGGTWYAIPDFSNVGRVT